MVTVRIEMCSNLNCPKKLDCYRFLGFLFEPEKYIFNTIRFHNLCNEKNNYKWQWFGGVEKIKEKYQTKLIEYNNQTKIEEEVIQKNNINEINEIKEQMDINEMT